VTEEEDCIIISLVSLIAN